MSLLRQPYNKNEAVNNAPSHGIHDENHSDFQPAAVGTGASGEGAID